MRKTQAKILWALALALKINYRKTKRAFVNTPRPKRREWLGHLEDITLGIGVKVAEAVGPLKAASLFCKDYGKLDGQDLRRILRHVPAGDREGL